MRWAPRKYGISSGQLYLWRSQLKPERLDGAANQFVPVAVTTEGPQRIGMIEIVLPHGVMLRVGPDIDAAALRRVLSALAGR